MKYFVSVLALGLAVAMPVAAQDGATPPPGPCEGEAYHQLDFWLGNWEVSDAEGIVQGVNTITREEGGCMLLERWTSTLGNTGQSYNFYNPATEEWRQLWISQGTIIDYVGGLTDTGSMRLEGTITNHNGAVTAPFTGEWTLNEDGSVTQHFEQYSTEKDEWIVWFTGIYRRAESDQL